MVSSLSSQSWRLGFVIGFALVSPSTFADQPPPPDARIVVADQISAFERGDAAGAWRLAAPEVREKFVSANRFIGAVEANFAPIYRHRSMEFGPAAQKGDEVGMVVTFVDNDNDVWSALFLLAKQKDGEWRTTGCMMAKAEQSSI